MHCELNIGDVFVWHNYPISADNIIKDRWFIYLGRTSPDDPAFPLRTIYVPMATTTSRTYYYESGGSRVTNKSIFFNAGEFGFEMDCVLDLALNVQLMPEECGKESLSLYNDPTETEMLDWAEKAADTEGWR